MIGNLCRQLNQLTPLTGLPPVRSGVVFGIDSDPAAKVTLILFDDQGRPRAVAKAARGPESEARLAAERDMLMDLEARALPTVAAQLPRLLPLDRLDGRAVLVTTALEGSPLTVRYYGPGHVCEPGRVTEDFAWASAWLASFQRETHSTSRQLDAEAFEAWVRPVFDSYASTVGWEDWERAFVDWLYARWGELEGTWFPVTAVHGDFAIGNVLTEGAGVSGVVDWECGRPVGLPLTDVFKFAVSYSSYLDRACPAPNGSVRGHPGWPVARARWGVDGGWSNLAGIVYGLFGRGWFPDLVRWYLRTQFSRLGVPRALAALCLPVFVAEQALALDNPVFRNGYRQLLRLLWQNGDPQWPELLGAS